MGITAKELVESVRDIASLPSIYVRLRAAVDDVRASNSDIGRLISEDTGLTARLLRIANSSFYGSPAKVDTITRAVTVIGTRQISDIVLATSVQDMFAGIPEDKVSMKTYWHHSISCGVMSRVLATYRREPNVERFFIAGLLHDIGRLILYMQMPQRYWEIVQQADTNNELLDVAERHELGFDHAEVGGLLLRNWELPNHMVDAVRYHHRPSKNGYHGIEGSVIHVAEVMTSAVRAAQGEKVLLPQLDDKAWSALSLPVSIMTPAIIQMNRQYLAVVRLIFPDQEEADYACA